MALSEKASSAADKARTTADRTAGATREAQDSRPFRALVMVGLIVYGVLHLLVAWIVLQLAWSASGDEASQDGALSQVAQQPMGSVLLWVCAVGLAGLVIWQVLEAAWGHRHISKESKRTRRRIGSVGKAVLYGALAVSAAGTAMGSKSSGSGESGGSDAQESLTADLLSVTLGRVLVVAVGIAVIAVGVAQIRRGILKKFTEDLVGGVSPAVVRLGQIGFIAKGIVLSIIGILFGWAAVTADPEKAGGMDDALRTLKEQTFGPYLLTIVAIGLAAFGVYCFAWSRRARQ